MPDDKSLAYINSENYEDWDAKLKELHTILEDNTNKSFASRKLRYAEVDIEAEREEGRLQPDELYIPQHIIDTNIRREQSPYVQFVSQSPRAVILEDTIDDTVDYSLLEKDLTKKLRFDGWELSMFANIDGFQANGYSVMEVVYDKTAPGGVIHESVQYGDFAFLTDTRDIQAVEMCSRAYYFTRTRLLALSGDPQNPQPENFDYDQTMLVINADPTSSNTGIPQEMDTHERSLYRVEKVMFRINGVINVAWVNSNLCNDWLRKPLPLYLGRRKLDQHGIVKGLVAKAIRMMPAQQPQLPPSSEQYETQFPYYLFPYLISENDTIANLKGRVFLDQDIQEAITSLLSSTCTQARRCAGLYMSRDTNDPNDDILMEKNIFFKSGTIVNGKISQFQLSPPDPAMFSAINMLVTGNQNETSQVNFAVNNRKDSRKTAKEISVASQQATILSSVQVVLFSLSLKQMYRNMVSIVTSRVKSGLIQVNPALMPLYSREFTIKPSGNVDVIEKQQLIQTMMQSLQFMSNTAAGPRFLVDLIELMFPLNAPKYIAALQQQMQQSQSQQAQMMQQGLKFVMSMAKGIIKLSENPAMFSDMGRLHAFPIVEHYADEIKQIEQMMKGQQQSGGQHKQKQVKI